MTEYDFSPGAYARYMATQRRIADWVDHTEGHRPTYGNAFLRQPSMQEPGLLSGSVSRAHPLLPSDQTLRTSRSQNFCSRLQSRSQTPFVPSDTGTHRSGSKHNLQPPNVTGHSLRASQSQNFYPFLRSHPASRKHSSATLRDHASAQALTYVASTGTGKSALVYAPAGSVPSGGLVILPSNGNGKPPSIIVSPPVVQSSHASQYQSRVYPAAPTYQVSVSSHHTAVPLPPPPFTQKIYPTSGYAYQQNLHTGGVTGPPLVSPSAPPAPGYSSTVYVMQPIVMPVIEKTRRSRSVGRKGRKRDKERGKEREGKRSRSEVRGRRGDA